MELGPEGGHAPWLCLYLQKTIMAIQVWKSRTSGYKWANCGPRERVEQQGRARKTQAPAAGISLDDFPKEGCDWMGQERAPTGQGPAKAKVNEQLGTEAVRKASRGAGGRI